MTQILFDGQKAVAIDSLPASAWTWFTPHLTEEGENAKTIYQKVPWLNRGVELRADAIGSLPFSLMKGDAEFDTSAKWENKVGFLPNPQRLFHLVETSLTITGQAYLHKLRNRVVVLDLQYWVPTTIAPVITKEAGLVVFGRNVGGGTISIPIEDMIYFWPPDSYVEVGPAQTSPAMAALNAAGVLYNVDEFASGYFKRGMIKATLLTLGSTTAEPERKKLKAWWKRVFSGIGNAWQTEVVNADVTPVTLGEGIKELSDVELTGEKREDISTALGVPQAKLFSNAANYATAGVDDLAFYKETIVPRAEFIASVLNEQLFEPMGYHLKFKPETLDVFQVDEQQRSTAFLNYTNAGLPLEVAGPMLGLELPEGVGWEQLAAEKEERRQVMQDNLQGSGDKQPFAPTGEAGEREAQANKGAMHADLRNWRTKARKRGQIPPFESDHITDALADAIKATGDVELAFSWMKKDSPLQAERRMRKKVLALLEKYLPAFTTQIYNNGQPPYTEMMAELRATLGPEIAQIVTEQGLTAAAEVGVEFDSAVVNAEAAEWARSYTYDLITGLEETTRKVVQNAITAFAETPGMTRGQLEEALQHGFNDTRASMIAVTETTRGYAQATNQYQKLIKDEAGVDMERIWNTNADELVCPVCGPLHGLGESEWAEMFPGGPPAHVNCRCFLTLRYAGG